MSILKSWLTDTSPRRPRGRTRTTVRPWLEELDGRWLLSGNVPTAPVNFMPDTPFKLGNYYIDVPSSYDASNQTPTTLFVWSHGAGGFSQFDIDDYKWTSGTPYVEIALDGREGGAWDVNADPAAVLAAIADVKTHFNIDPDRVILGGYSSGGDLSYRVAFTNSTQIAGVLAENTTPFRDTGLTQDQALSSASFKFHVVQLAHTEDDTYPIATVQSETDAVKNAGFPLQLIERPGMHFDNNTVSDYQTLVLPHISDGWTSPADVGAPASPTPLLVSGEPNGTAQVYIPGAGGEFGSPSATLQPFGVISADVRTAVGDVNGDGIPDDIFATGPGTPFEVMVINGKDGSVLVAPFDPFLPAPPLAQTDLFTAGGFVSAGDFLSNGRTQIIVSPDQSGGPRVAIYDMNGAATAGPQPATPVGVNTTEINPGSGLTRIANFLSVDENFRGGARTAVGDLNGDGIPDLAIAAGYGGGPAVLVINGTKVPTTDGFTQSDDLISNFYAFNSTLRDGAYLAIGDVFGNGQQDLILGPGDGGPAEVEVLNGPQLINTGAVATIASPSALFTPTGLGPNGSGLRVAVAPTGVGDDVNVIVGAGRNMPGFAKVYPVSGFTSGSTTEPTGGQLLIPFGGAALTDGIFVG